MNNLVQQILSSGNPSAIVGNLIASNPNVANAVPIVKEIMKSGSKKEQLRKACNKCGANYSEVEKQIKSLGINID